MGETLTNTCPDDRTLSDPSIDQIMILVRCLSAVVIASFVLGATGDIDIALFVGAWHATTVVCGRVLPLESAIPMGALRALKR